jgi:hypothetical protein
VIDAHKVKTIVVLVNSVLVLLELLEWSGSNCGHGVFSATSLIHVSLSMAV